jgi:hypothetical protein
VQITPRIVDDEESVEGGPPNDPDEIGRVRAPDELGLRTATRRHTGQYR